VQTDLTVTLFTDFSHKAMLITGRLMGGKERKRYTQTHTYS